MDGRIAARESFPLDTIDNPHESMFGLPRTPDGDFAKGALGNRRKDLCYFGENIWMCARKGSTKRQRGFEQRTSSEGCIGTFFQVNKLTNSEITDNTPNIKMTQEDKGV